MAEMIIVKSKIKEVAGGSNVSGDFAEALNEWAVGEVNKAAKRAEANGRKTLQSKDVYVGDMHSHSMLVVKSKIKNVVDNGQSVSGDFADALNELVVHTVMQSAKRAESNGRKTIGAKDL